MSFLLIPTTANRPQSPLPPTSPYKSPGASPRFSSAALVLLLALGGCATPPDTMPPPSVGAPSGWSSDGFSTEEPQPWIKTFDDPRLSELVERALKNNPDLTATAARLDQTVAEARIAGADRIPGARADLDASRQKINAFGPQSTGGVRFEDYSLQMNVNWELDVWGRLRDQHAATIGRVQAAEADLRAARLSLAARVAQAWFNLLEARMQLELARDTAEADRKNLASLESRFERGLVDGLDLRRISSQSATSEAEVEQRNRAIDLARRNLSTLLGAYPSGEADADAELPDPPSALPAGLPAQLLSRRPDLIAAERRLAAAETEITSAKKEWLPQISLTAAGGTSSQEFEELLNSDFAVWNLGGNLTQPIFQGGRIAGGVDRAQALRDQAAADYKSAALQAFREVETALAAEPYLKNQYNQLHRAAEEAEAAEDLAWERYRQGTASFLDALDARRTADNTRSQAIRLRNQVLQNRIDLYLALGGPVLKPQPRENP